MARGRLRHRTPDASRRRRCRRPERAPAAHRLAPRSRRNARRIAGDPGRPHRASARACGFLPEDRPFEGHVTLARARRGPRAPAVDLPDAAELGSFVADRLVLYRSRLGGGGSTYEELASYPLDARGTVMTGALAGLRSGRSRGAFPSRGSCIGFAPDAICGRRGAAIPGRRISCAPRGSDGASSDSRWTRAKGAAAVLLASRLGGDPAAVAAAVGAVFGSRVLAVARGARRQGGRDRGRSVRRARPDRRRRRGGGFPDRGRGDPPRCGGIGRGRRTLVGRGVSLRPRRIVAAVRRS